MLGRAQRWMKIWYATSERRTRPACHGVEQALVALTALSAPSGDTAVTVPRGDDGEQTPRPH
jgi:hypothetical protein